MRLKGRIDKSKNINKTQSRRNTINSETHTHHTRTALLPPPPTPKTLITHGLNPPSGINAVALLESAVVDEDAAAVVVDNPTTRLVLYFCARDTCADCSPCIIMRRITPLSRRIPKNVRFGPNDWGDSSERIVVDEDEELVSSPTASE